MAFCGSDERYADEPRLCASSAMTSSGWVIRDSTAWKRSPAKEAFVATMATTGRWPSRASASWSSTTGSQRWLDS